MFPNDKNRKNRFLFLTGILLLLVSALLFGLSNNTQKKKKEFLRNPQTGDVYLVKESKKKETSYYFLRVSELWEDSIIFYHSSFEYSDIVKELDKEDYFALDEQLIFTKSQLQQMFENGEISRVERNYGSNESFNRMKYE